MSTPIDRLAERITTLERGLRAATTTPQLAYSSLEGGAIEAYDRFGNPTMIIGEQFDGTNGAVAVTGPVPPTPSAPIVQAVNGGLLVRWDGTFENDAIVPLDFSRVEVHTNPGPAGFDATTADTLRNTIETPRGGELLIPLSVELHSVALVARSLPGMASLSSVQVEATPLEGEVQLTDSQPPGSSPTPLVRPGIGALVITWPEVDNADYVSYDVYISKVSGFTPDASTFAGTAGGTFYLARTLPDGSPLANATLYYVRIIARDADGSAAPSPQGSSTTIAKITKTEISDNAIETPQLAANAVTAGYLIANGAWVGALRAVDFTAETITGPLIQTQLGATSGIKLNGPSNQLVAYAGGVQTLLVDGNTGDVVITGSIRTGPSGARAELEDGTWSGEVGARLRLFSGIDYAPAEILNLYEPEIGIPALFLKSPKSTSSGTPAQIMLWTQSSTNSYLELNAKTVGLVASEIVLDAPRLTIGSSVRMFGPTLMQMGTTTMNPVADTLTTKRVYFDYPFTSTPRVFVQVQTGTSSNIESKAWTSDMDMYGFQLNYRRGNTTQTTFQYLAVDLRTSEGD